MATIFTWVGRLLGIAVLGAIIIMTWAFFLPPKGVRTPNTLESYATNALMNFNILMPDERLLAYYDMSFLMNGTEAAIITDKRLIHHYKDESQSMSLDSVADVYLQFSPKVIHQSIDIKDSQGHFMRLAILHEQDVFHRILMDAWHRTDSKPTKTSTQTSILVPAEAMPIQPVNEELDGVNKGEISDIEMFNNSLRDES